MIKNIKVWDVQQPKDEWGRSYAKLAYAFTGLDQTFSTRIEVGDEAQSYGPSYDFISGELIEDKENYYDTWSNGEAEV